MNILTIYFDQMSNVKILQNNRRNGHLVLIDTKCKSHVLHRLHKVEMVIRMVILLYTAGLSIY